MSCRNIWILFENYKVCNVREYSRYLKTTTFYSIDSITFAEVFNNYYELNFNMHSVQISAYISSSTAQLPNHAIEMQIEFHDVLPTYTKQKPQRRVIRVLNPRKPKPGEIILQYLQHY